MALIAYPTDSYDSLVSIVDATVYITNYSVHSSQWLALDDATREVYLRIATDRILNVIDTTLLDEGECLKKATALIAVNDIAYSISSEINPNTGVVSKEKVGDIERQYYHGDVQGRTRGINKNPFPLAVVGCLNSYGAELNIGNIRQASFLRS